MPRSLGQGMPFRVSWGALFAGAVASLGVLVLLYTFGIAVGLSSVDPRDGSTVRASGIFTGVWGLATPLIALFVGGMVAGRAVGATSRMGGAVHGLVVWSLTAVGGVCLIAALFGGLVGSAVTVGENVAAQAMAGDAKAAPASPPASSGDGVVAEAKQKLDQVGAIANKQMQKSALAAAPRTGTVVWVVFGALCLGLLAAMLGGAAGVTRQQRTMAELGAGAITPEELAELRQLTTHH